MTGFTAIHDLRPIKLDNNGRFVCSISQNLFDAVTGYLRNPKSNRSHSIAKLIFNFESSKVDLFLKHDGKSAFVSTRVLNVANEVVDRNQFGESFTSCVFDFIVNGSPLELPNGGRAVADLTDIDDSAGRMSRMT